MTESELHKKNKTFLELMVTLFMFSTATGILRQVMRNSYFLCLPIY